MDTQGDFFFVAFRTAKDAVWAAADAQRDLAAHEWPQDATVRVRMGLHTGEPKVGEERYVGIGVHRAARIGAVGHGGQALLSWTTKGLAEEDLPPGVAIRDLGQRRLRDIDQPQHLSTNSRSRGCRASSRSCARSTSSSSANGEGCTPAQP